MIEAQKFDTTRRPKLGWRDWAALLSSVLAGSLFGLRARRADTAAASASPISTNANRSGERP
ncbi:MAG: hypothetical protein MO853_11580 [Candidatus Protistobacter heckmanni]|nr:hypothetical protein [Candidatus Protistobacter heckmanni]